MNIRKDLTSVNRDVLTGKANKYIVIHYTGNQTDKAASNANYFRSTYRGASAHYFVDKTEVVQVVEDKDASWAVGKNYGSGNLYGIVTNNNSISIEMCSDNGIIADETFNNTVELTKQLMKTHGIPADHVYRHWDVCSKHCPGWDGWLPPNEAIWDRFKSSLTEFKAPKNVKNAIYRLYDGRTHMFTASATERNSLIQSGWTYEGVGWKSDGKGEDVIRFYNKNTGDHFFTANKNEKPAGFVDEGVAFKSSKNKKAKIYRLYNGRYHFYTKNIDEKKRLTQAGWKSEGVAFYGY